MLRTVPRPTLSSSSSTEEDVLRQGRVLMEDYIENRMVRDNILNPPRISNLQEPRGPLINHGEELGRFLQRKGDELDNDPELQSLIERVPPNAESQAFTAILRTIFDDGVYNWGRIIVLFYIAYKLSVNALSYNPSFIRSIIGHTLSFMSDRIAHWILQQGGWEAIVEYVGDTWNWKHMAAAAVAVGAVAGGVAFFYFKGE